MRVCTCRVGLLALLLGTASTATEIPSPDLAKLERRIGKEPIYKGKPGYLLLVFGADAKHRVWLVLDGETLYVDRHATGDLSQPECCVKGEADDYPERLFKVGDLTLGGKLYGDLRVAVYSAKSSAGSGLDEMPMFQKFLAAKPDGKLYSISVDVPLEKPLPDLRDKSPVKSTRHFANQYDATGILQFAARPQGASIIHFGGPWTFAPDGQQKLVRGRNEDLALRLGTPGHGPGTFAFIGYDFLVPESAKPKLLIKYLANPGEKARTHRYLLEDRC
jgi:hypothetical protein